MGELQAMTDWNPRANQIFLNALDLETEEERHAYLHETCGEDHALRAEDEGLLQADTDAEGFLNQTLREPGQTTPFTPVPVELDAMVVGPYQLRSVIAEGGMGVVYEADQEEPVRRTVALKIIKPGMDSQAVIARFEALAYRRKMARDRLVFREDVFDLMADEGAEELDSRREEHSALEDCLAAMPEKQRQFVTLAYTPGIKVKEMAEEAGSSAAAFYMRLKRLRHHLMSCVENKITQSGQT